MEQPTILRETKIGQKGYVKEDVLMYLDELNSKNEELKKQLEQASGNSQAEPQEIIKFRNQVENLQEKLNASNNALRAAKKENDELQKTIEKLKAGGASGGATTVVDNPQTKAALDAAKKEIDKLRAQLKNANEKPVAPAPNNAQAQAAIEAAKKEIDSLRAKLKTADQKVADAQKRASEAEKKADEASKSANTDNGIAVELEKTKQEITKITAELNSKAEELKEKSAELDQAKKNSAEKDSKIKQLSQEVEETSKKKNEKDDEIAKLNTQIQELKATTSNPAALMGSLFAEAQKNIDQLKKDEQEKIEKLTREATEKANAVVNEANATAEKTVREANATAEKTVREANATAEKTVREANETAEKTITGANKQAKDTVDDANLKAGKINEMSSTVRSMLMNEIESVNIKFRDITTSLKQLTTQATDKMNEAQGIIGEARKAVEPNSDNTVKLYDAPTAGFTAAKAPTGNDPFASITGGSYNSGSSVSSNYSSSSYGSSSYSKPTPPPAPVTEAPKEEPPKKTINSFNFDMAELLKAAEEEAAKEEQK